MEPRQPIFSIIIPTRNRSGHLAACLKSLAHLDYPCDRFEVIVVDDGSETPVDGVVAAIRERIDVSLATQAHAGPATARNRGAAGAKGEFLAFTDDDCAPAPDWLQRLAARFAAMPQCLIGGRTINGLTENPYSTASQMLIDYLYSHYNAHPDHAAFFTSNNLAVNAAYFQAIGGFDGSFPRAAAEDREFCDRWMHNGGRMIYAAEALVWHSHSLTLRSFWRQHFSYGRGGFHFHCVRARRGRGRIRLEPFRFYVDLIRYPSSKTQKRQAWSIAGLLVLTQVANAAGFFWEKISTFRDTR